MRVLSVAETAAWFANRRLEFRPAVAWGSDHQLEMPAGRHRIWFETPHEARRQLSLVHLLSSWLDCESALLAINVAALYAPYELDALLFLRRCHGEMRWVDDVPGGATPGHQFGAGPEARRQVREFMTAMLAYTFQGYLVQDDGRDVIWLADGIIDVYCHELQRIHLIKDIVDLLGLRLCGADTPVAH